MRGWPLVDVRMHVFSVLRIAPSGEARTTKQSRKNFTSFGCIRLLQLSTYASVRALVPLALSPESPLDLQRAARASRSCWSWVKILLKTAANTGEAGQPCEKSLCTGIIVQVPSLTLTKVLPALS